MRTIKAKLQKVLKRHGKFVSRVDLLKSINREQLETIRELKKELEQMNNPTTFVADVAPVVRCEDCSHCSIEGSLYLCALWNHLTELDDFCSDAKRWEEQP